MVPMVGPVSQTMPTTPVMMRTKPALFFRGKRLLQDNARKECDHQRHDAGKQCPRMCRGREQQTAIGKQDGWGSAEHECREPDPTEPFESKTHTQQKGKQQQSGDDETDRRDVPRGEARPEPKAGDHDVSGPDAYGGETKEGAAGVSRGCTTTGVGSRSRAHHSGNLFTAVLWLCYRKNRDEARDNE